MKKIFVTLIASMLLLSSTTYATEKFGTLNKADSQALFGQSNMHALALDQNEMMKTEGEFWGWVVAAIAAFIVGSDSRRNQGSQQDRDRSDRQVSYGVSKLTPRERAFIKMGMSGSSHEDFQQAIIFLNKAAYIGKMANIK